MAMVLLKWTEADNTADDCGICADLRRQNTAGGLIWLHRRSFRSAAVGGRRKVSAKLRFHAAYRATFALRAVP